MIAIAHESPNSIFKEVQKLTDYDYALVHLLAENEEYCNHFIEAKEKGREIILDNSIFELGTAFDSSKFAYWVEKLQPTYYIVPDSLDNFGKTVSNYFDFCRDYKNLPGKKIGVLQGKTYQELIDCYKSIAKMGVDMIAVSFNYKYYEECFDGVDSEKLSKWCLGRILFLSELVEEKFFDKTIPLHLLGCSLPQEFTVYRDNIDIGQHIYSVDTSNPVIHGMKCIPYENGQLTDKVSTKLFTLIESEIDSKQLECIRFNIDAFRKNCNK